MSAWLTALEQRHLANLTRSELTRALRALSSCYVERRDKLESGAALEGAGKRAAFALFYGPLHFLTSSEVLKALNTTGGPPRTIHDLGCGTGVGGAAWALACDGAPTIDGIDRNAWAVSEANWTYRELALRGRAVVGDAIRKFPGLQDSRFHDLAFVVAYAANELPDASRRQLLDRLVHAVTRGARVLVIEPIARRDRPWWPEWARSLIAAGAREDEWRFRAPLPDSLRQIAKAAGLDPRELTARTLTKLG